MKKIVFVLILVTIFIVAGCSKEETGVVAKEATQGNKSGQTEKDNELTINYNGKTEVIPAETMKNVGYATEIKVPLGTEATYTEDSNMILFTNLNEQTRINFQLVETDMSVDEFLNENRFTFMNHSKAKDITLDEYPELEYDKIITDGENYNLAKEVKVGEKRLIKHVFIDADNPKKLGTLLSVLASMKHTPDYKLVDEVMSNTVFTLTNMPVSQAGFLEGSSFHVFDTPERRAIIEKLNALAETFTVKAKNKDYDPGGNSESAIYFSGRNPEDVTEVFSVTIEYGANSYPYIVVSHEKNAGKEKYSYYEYDKAKANELFEYMKSLQPDSTN